MDDCTDQSETLAFLGQPSTYGPGTTEVKRVDTHASSVFLVGACAYKLKRAVRFSYLDYGTPELRRRACEAEVALNRRTAPDLYIGVVPITRSVSPDGSLTLGGEGPAVDWLVVMRRFDEAWLLDRMAEEHRLPVPLMRDLADEIADFHAGAEVDRAEGGTAGLRAVLHENDANLREAGVFDVARIDALREAAEAALTGLESLLEHRRLDGKVRLCHGDLHLRNICLLDGRPTLFDGIEFSRSIACIDVLYDLAFLIMDLDQRGLRGHANLVLNRYLDRTHEDDGLAALPLFLSTRAAIRAHTTAAAAGRKALASERDRILADAHAYLAAAVNLLRPMPPMLIAIGGFSGTGKSTLAYGLAPDLGAAPGARIVRSDVLRKRLMGVAPEAPLGAEGYTAAVTERVYAALRTDVATALAAGRAAVADAVFAREAEREAIAAVAHAAGVPFVGLWLEAPIEILESRVRGRGRADASDATMAVLHRQVAGGAERVRWIPLNAAAGVEDCLAAARVVLNRAIPPGSRGG